MRPAEFTCWLRTDQRSFRARPPTAGEWVGILARLATVERPPGPAMFVVIDLTPGGILMLEERRGTDPGDFVSRSPA